MEITELLLKLVSGELADGVYKASDEALLVVDGSSILIVVDGAEQRYLRSEEVE